MPRYWDKPKSINAKPMAICGTDTRDMHHTTSKIYIWDIPKQTLQTKTNQINNTIRTTKTQ